QVGACRCCSPSASWLLCSFDGPRCALYNTHLVGSPHALARTNNATRHEAVTRSRTLTAAWQGSVFLQVEAATMHISTWRRGTRLVRALCLGAWLACVGCGERRADVSGKATVDGKPLNSKLITILFAPDLDNPLKKIPSGVLDEQGNYTMS